jgi:hypothetical protein
MSVAERITGARLDLRCPTISLEIPNRSCGPMINGSNDAQVSHCPRNPCEWHSRRAVGFASLNTLKNRVPRFRPKLVIVLVGWSCLFAILAQRPVRLPGQIWRARRKQTAHLTKSRFDCTERAAAPILASFVRPPSNSLRGALTPSGPPSRCPRCALSPISTPLQAASRRRRHPVV